MSWHKIKICKGYLFSCLGLSTAILVWLQSQTQAQFISSVEPIEIYQLATPQILTIPPIRQSEITFTTKSESVNNPRDLLAPPLFNTSIVREFPRIWQMRVPLDQVDSLYATYDIRGQNGNDNAMSNEQHSDAAVPVVIEPLPIMEISRDPNSNTAVLQGGFRLKMDLSSSQFAGTYSGDLTVIVDRR
ncbi:hypothetical protein [Fischerella sp. PCC 9605]|uniref:hypothetical protein n=1 Tax=Fischerella sp. PCC 9605 TaxID=1173024 RepID=UPI00047C15F0|nr:hypothetical protein [Fischerella sp. PCC 9605]